MGCFLGCFGGSKNVKNRHKNSHIAHVSHHNPNFGKQYNPIHQTVAAKEDLFDECINLPIIESRVEPQEENLNSANQHKQEEQLSLGAQKRVTFDSNVKEYDHVSCNEAPEILQEDEVGVKADSTKPGKCSSSESGSTSSSLVSFPLNHRYQNCRESDDEVSDLDEDEDELSEDDDDELSEDDHDEDDDEESYNAESSDDEYYSRQVPEISTRSCSSMESGTKSSTTCASNDRHGDEPTKDNGSLDKETNTPPVFYRGARDRTGYVHSVLNPVENTAQWKNVKAKQTLSMKHHQKENSQMDLAVEQSTLKSKSNLDDPDNTCEVVVDASLSTWLDSTQKTPPNKLTPIVLEPISSAASTSSSQWSNSVRIKEERPILGALTMEELKQFSASSPRKSPSRSPNEKPLVGTVGLHWNNKSDRTPVEDSSSSSFKGIPNTTSKYKEDKRVTWHSTPFETRLEKALNRGATDSYT